VNYAELPYDKQARIEGAEFRHFYVWRAAYKEGSVSTPIRIVVDPSSTGLNICLAKGENQLTKIPEVLIRFRNNPVAWCSDISKMYNMLKLKDEALPYSLLLFHESLDEAINPDVYVMTAAWYGVSSTGNQANVAVDRLWMANQHKLPEAAGPLGPNRYMDDVDSGADTREQVGVQVEQVRECLSRGGFKPKFVAYSREPPSEAASADG
jgi:hypothetical protein